MADLAFGVGYLFSLFPATTELWLMKNDLTFSYMTIFRGFYDGIYDFYVYGLRFMGYFIIDTRGD